jgi:hypothetical protein
MAIDKLMGKNISDLSKIIGIDKANLSKFMGSGIPTYIFKDTFTGANGSDPNSVYWNPNQYLKIQNNQLHCSIPATNQGQIISKFKITGDFDVFVSFDDLVLGGINYGNNLRFLARNSDSSDHVLFDVRNQYTGQIFLSNVKYNGSYYGEVYTARSNSYGGLRLIRSGTTITIRYKDGTGDWTTLSSRILGLEDMFIWLGTYSASGTVTGDFDDFTIESGTMI